MQVACNIRAAVQREMALTMSFGIAVGKLAARLAGPLHKPSGMTVVPPHRAPAFLLDTPILKVPHLRCVLISGCCCQWPNSNWISKVSGLLMFNW